MLRSDLYDYAEAYILVNGTIIVTAAAGANNIRDNALFVSCITRING